MTRVFAALLDQQPVHTHLRKHCRIDISSDHVHASLDQLRDQIGPRLTDALHRDLETVQIIRASDVVRNGAHGVEAAQRRIVQRRIVIGKLGGAGVPFNQVPAAESAAAYAPSGGDLAAWEKAYLD